MSSLLKRFILTIVFLIAGWDLFIIVATNRPTPWLWIVRRPHYEISFSFQLPDGVHTARGVVEAVYFADPWWDQTLPPLPLFGMGQVVGRGLNGEAVTMCLPDGQAISMALEYQFMIIPKRSGPLPVVDNDVYSLANALLTQDHPAAFQRIIEWGEWVRYITAFSADSVAGSYSIPENKIPSMVFFKDASDLHSARLLDPRGPQTLLGPGSKFLGATLSLTNSPVRSDSKKCLPWLNYCPEGHGLAPPASKPDVNDPIVVETNDKGITLSWCSYFLYGSRV